MRELKRKSKKKELFDTYLNLAQQSNCREYLERFVSVTKKVLIKKCSPDKKFSILESEIDILESNLERLNFSYRLFKNGVISQKKLNKILVNEIGHPLYAVAKPINNI
jgi:hypothetical protein